MFSNQIAFFGKESKKDVFVTSVHKKQTENVLKGFLHTS